MPTQSVSTSNKNEYVFRDMPPVKALWTFAFPAVISQLVLLAYNLADTWFLGRVGNPYMVAAASLILPVYNICGAMANLFGTGGGTLIARLLGAQKHDEAKKVSACSVACSLVLSAAFAAFMYAFRTPVLRFLGASDATMEYASQYCFWVLIVGAVPSVLSVTMSILARNAGLAREAALGISLSGLLNIILDPLFMFVILPPGNEVTGAAVATLISNICGACFYVTVFIANKDKSVLRLLPRTGLPSRNSVAQLFSVGIPSGLTTFLFDLAHITIDKLVAGHGDIALAAIGIVLKVERLPLNICLGICFGMVPLIGYNYAARNFDRMKKLHRTAILYGLAVSAASIVLYMTFAGTIMRIFISEPETVRIGTSFLRVRCLTTFMMFSCFNFCFFFQAVGMGICSLALAIVRQLVFNIPMLFLFNSLFGMMGIVWTQITADTCTVIVSLLLYRFVGKRTWEIAG